MTYSATATALHLASLGNGSEAIAVLTGAADRSDAWAKRRYIVPASPTINVPNVLRRSHVA